MSPAPSSALQHGATSSSDSPISFVVAPHLQRHDRGLHAADGPSAAGTSTSAAAAQISTGQISTGQISAAQISAGEVTIGDLVLGSDRLTVIPGPAAPGPGWRIVAYLAVPDCDAKPENTQVYPVPTAAPPSAAHGADASSVRVDRDTRTASVDGRSIALTFMEFELLDFFVSSPRRVHSRTQLLRSVWERFGGSDDGRTVDVHVARLRRKLGERHRHRIVTVRGFGYRYDPEPVAAAHGSA